MKIPKFRELPWIKEIIDYREIKQAFGESFDEALRAQPELRKARQKCSESVMKIAIVPFVLATCSFLIMKIVDSAGGEKPPEPYNLNRPTSEVIIPGNQDPKSVSSRIRETVITDPKKIRESTRVSNNIKIHTNNMGEYLRELSTQFKGIIFSGDIDVSPITEKLFQFYHDKALAPGLKLEGIDGFTVIELDKAGKEYFDTPARVWLRDYNIPFYHKEKKTILFNGGEKKPFNSKSDLEKLQYSFLWLALSECYDDLAPPDGKLSFLEKMQIVKASDFEMEWVSAFISTFESTSSRKQISQNAINEDTRNALRNFEKLQGVQIIDQRSIQIYRNFLRSIMEQLSSVDAKELDLDENLVNIALYKALRIACSSCEPYFVDGISGADTESISMIDNLKRMSDEVMLNPGILQH